LFSLRRPDCSAARMTAANRDLLTASWPVDAPRGTAVVRAPPRLDRLPADDLGACAAGLLADVCAMTITPCWSKCTYVEHTAAASQLQYALPPPLLPLEPQDVELAFCDLARATDREPRAPGTDGGRRRRRAGRARAPRP